MIPEKGLDEKFQNFWPQVFHHVLDASYAKKIGVPNEFLNVLRMT
jgi:hypothetical protein